MIVKNLWKFEPKIVKTQFATIIDSTLIIAKKE